MTQRNDIKTFNNLCEKHSIWIVKYCSVTFNSPLFLIWYTDENTTDRLLTFKNGEIFATDSIANLNTIVLDALDDLVVFENLQYWITDCKDLEATEFCTYDLISIIKSISKNNLETATIEDFVDFINLYSDFVYQDIKNSHLQGYVGNKLIKKTWDYYYKHIFWARLNDKAKFDTSSRPQLVIDKKKLLSTLTEIIMTFEENLKLTVKPIS